MPKKIDRTEKIEEMRKGPLRTDSHFIWLTSRYVGLMFKIKKYTEEAERLEKEIDEYIENQSVPSDKLDIKEKVTVGMSEPETDETD